jgi:hypothetical protein
MSCRFSGDDSLVLVHAEILGPARRVDVWLALDTGAITTMISSSALVAAGYDPIISSSRIQVTTASGIVFAPLVTVEKFDSLGQVRTQFPVISYTLPPSAGVDGLLGLDFLRGQSLTVDFRTGEITLC